MSDLRARVLAWVDSFGDPIRLYREVVIPPGGRLDEANLGRFWTPVREKAVSPFGRSDHATGARVLVEALARRADVDEFETVATMRRYPAEQEIRLREGARVQVVRVEERRANPEDDVERRAREAALQAVHMGRSSASPDRVAKDSAGKWWVRVFGHYQSIPSPFRTKREALEAAARNEEALRERGITSEQEAAVLAALQPRSFGRPAPKAKLSRIVRGMGGAPPGGWTDADRVGNPSPERDRTIRAVATEALRKLLSWAADPENTQRLVRTDLPRYGAVHTIPWRAIDPKAPAPLRRLVIAFADSPVTARGSFLQVGDYDRPGVVEPWIALWHAYKPSDASGLYYGIEPYSSTFVHEFVHFLDSRRQGEAWAKSATRAEKKSQKASVDYDAYVTTPEEWNAHYQQGFFALEEDFRKQLPGRGSVEKLRRFAAMWPDKIPGYRDKIAWDAREYLHWDYLRERLDRFWGHGFLAAMLSDPERKKRFLKRLRVDFEAWKQRSAAQILALWRALPPPEEDVGDFYDAAVAASERDAGVRQNPRPRPRLQHSSERSSTSALQGRLTSEARASLLAELDRIKHEIDALYWTFTRTRRGKPPAVVRPDLYARRAEIERLLGRGRARPRRRNPLADSEDLAQKLYDSMPFPLVEIPRAQVNLATADRGHPVVDEPERYRWFLVPKFPVAAFGLRLDDLTSDAGSYASQEKHRHDVIVEALRRGPAWPAIVTADGVLVDGFHRVTANKTLRRRFMPVIVAVRIGGHSFWDETWNEAAANREQNPRTATTPDAFLREFDALWRRSPLAHLHYTLQFSERLSRIHRRNRRRYAECEPAARRFFFAREILTLPARHRLGLAAHEIGHALHGSADHSEDDADRAALAGTGVRIGYDRRWPGKGVQVKVNPGEPRGSCYKQAFDRAKKIHEIGLAKVLLVHGAVPHPASKTGEIPHAWVESHPTDGTPVLVYEPQSGRYYNITDWNRGKERPIVKYPFSEAQALAKSSRNYGPWDETSAALVEACGLYSAKEIARKPKPPVAQNPRWVFVTLKPGRKYSRKTSGKDYDTREVPDALVQASTRLTDEALARALAAETKFQPLSFDGLSDESVASLFAGMLRKEVAISGGRYTRIPTNWLLTDSFRQRLQWEKMPKENPPEKTRAQPIGRAKTHDDKSLVLWSDGSLTWGYAGTIVQGSPRATTPAQIEAGRDAGWLVLGDAPIYDAAEIPALVKAAREAVARGQRLPGAVRERFAAGEKRGRRLTPSWTVIQTDRDGRPRVRAWVLPRMLYGGMAVWDEQTGTGARGRYQVMREIGRTGTYEPTGFQFDDLDALSEHLRQAAELRRENPRNEGAQVTDVLRREAARIDARRAKERAARERGEIYEENPRPRRRPPPFPADALVEQKMETHRGSTFPVLLLAGEDWVRAGPEAIQENLERAYSNQIEFVTLGKTKNGATEAHVLWVLFRPDVLADLERHDRKPNPRARVEEIRVSRFLPLRQVERFVPLMQERGVSEVARSPRGFLTAYRRAGGPGNLPPDWLQRREAFIARHEAQVRRRGEPLYERDGSPTRRHLALIAWAYSPDEGGLRAPRRRNPAEPPTPAEMQHAAACWGTFPFRKCWIAKKEGQETKYIVQPSARYANNLAREGWSVYAISR